MIALVCLLRRHVKMLAVTVTVLPDFSRDQDKGRDTLACGMDFFGRRDSFDGSSASTP